MFLPPRWTTSHHTTEIMHSSSMRTTINLFASLITQARLRVKFGILVIDTPRPKMFFMEGLERRWRHPRERVPDQRHAKIVPSMVLWGLIWAETLCGQRA